MTPKDRVSASRLAALWGEHRYWTRRMLWEYTAKGVRVDRSGDPRARSGRALERAVLMMAAEDLACEIVPLAQGDDAYIRHASMPLGCKADGYVLHPERGPGLISAKCVSTVAWLNRWMSMRDGVPRDVEIQLQAEMIVWRGAAELPVAYVADEDGVAVETQLAPPVWGVVAALNDLDLKLFDRDFDPSFETLVDAELDRFFASIADDQPPPLSHVPEEMMLAIELWPPRPDSFEVVDADLDAEEAIELLMDATERRKAAAKDEDEAKLVILEAAEGANMVRGERVQCKVSQVQVRPSTCPSCGEIIRRGHTYARFTPKER